MALDKVTLITQLKAVFDGVSPETTGITDPAKLRQKVAEEMATAIDDFVKSATVTVASGIAVKTTGSATVQTGTTTVEGTGTIS